MVKKARSKELSFSEDYIWMSYRYCIGRHTIAAYMHAATIACDAYGKFPDERMQFNSEDINNEIHQHLHCGNFIDMGWYGNIPKNRFRPLDVVYSILEKEKIDTLEQFREIKSIEIDWNRDNQDFDYVINKKPHNDYGRSISDLGDLEIWQQLANLFDLKSHKWCKLIDGSIVEYYECWKHKMVAEGDKTKIKFQNYKIPVDRYRNLLTLIYIPEENIVEDNININERD